MREVKYLSPSQIALYEQSPELYYERYLSDNPPPRAPQNNAMAIGSAFDAYAKAYLHTALFGGNDPRFELRTIFEAQVEPDLRAWAWDHGKYVFEQYKQSGALADLMLLLQKSHEPRFEFEVRGAVAGYREGVEGEFGEVVLLGKPDVDFVTDQGVHVILDFKVNGYCSQWPKSPAPYYIRMRGAGRTNFGMHAKCSAMIHNGVDVNVKCGLDDIDKGWARQLAIYGWLCGEPIGSQFVTIIHQLVCSPNSGGLPTIRVAEHHNFVTRSFQQRVFDQAVELWEIVHSDWYYRDVSREESQRRCESIGMDTYKPMSVESIMNKMKGE